MIRLVLALIVSALPAWATQDQWPALHDVTGVAADDVLNIRAMPDAGAEIVGTLAPDATSIEVIRPNDRHTWGLVNAGERTGWVSLSFLSRQPGQWLGRVPQIAQCFGTEPFWHLDATVEPDGGLTLIRPDAVDRVFVRSAETGAIGRPGRHAIIGAAPAAQLSLVLTQNRCSDGMSDMEFGLTGDVLIDAGETFEMLSGCCSLSD